MGGNGQAVGLPRSYYYEESKILSLLASSCVPFLTKVEHLKKD